MSFDNEVTARINDNSNNEKLILSSQSFMQESIRAKYSYNFSWFGRPIIQYPQDMVALQEIIWEVKPDLIIETGIAHGGSLIFSASLLSQLDLFDFMEEQNNSRTKVTKRKVLGIDIDIRAHNKAMILKHPLSPWIEMLEGSSTDKSIVSKVRDIAQNYNTILVILDSNHTHQHVLDELFTYAPLVTKDSYCIIFDTIIEDLPNDMYPDRDWSIGNNPKTAVRKYLELNDNFKIDKNIFNKIQVSVAHDGYLRRIK
ncbi:cephalosporin hydroxylase family protein [Motilimonas cestriensis]|uniref:Cephalosporin hydroxylase family protein n=1 Tax=Motilimonas cestriensis TaxID=2742685 RepID=A0ABS8W990_9GAMM|nr:cephalosporin hydroxylase family protein [Motilimonas cestriensis]MCE2595576.1 cephalosporin hydroxylase family protein [Motilimonas cestriensis]